MTLRRLGVLSVMVVALLAPSVPGWADDAAAATPVPDAAGPADDYVPGSCIDNVARTPTTFGDLRAGAFYVEPVRWAFANGITQGVAPDRFAPDDLVTRGQFATMLHRMACLPDGSGDAASVFDDLRVGAFYLDAVDWLVAEGITTGKRPGEFAPDDPMTRGEFAAFLHRFVGTPGGAPTAPFVDNDRTRFYAEPVDWLVYRSVTQGTSASTFSPDRSITRGEVATFLFRLNTIEDIALRVQPVLSGLVSPTAAAVDPASGDIYITERRGTLRRVDADASGRPRWGNGAATVLDINTEVLSGGERGLLGVAIPDRGGEIYLSFTDNAGDSVIRRYALAGGRPTGAPGTIIEVDQTGSNHNGGNIVFGPDEMLYASFGDGGGSYDPAGNGQNLNTLLGKVVRIDVRSADSGRNYAIPADNPFVGVPGFDQIWLYGVRNPWKFTFDSLTGDLWIADVGQDAREEATRLPSIFGGGRGANLGWRLREGAIATPGVGGAAPADHIGPTLVYPTGPGGCSITGGYVYRGDDIPALWGTYLYADYCNPAVRAFNDRSGRVQIDLGPSVPGGQAVAFIEDGRGELAVMSLGGSVSTIERATG